MALPLGGASGAERKPVPVLQTEFNLTQGQFSPDSHWIAYTSNESGRSEIYVEPFPPSASGGGKWMVSRNGGAQPRWRRDGKELLYIAPDGKLMAVEVTTGPAFRSGISQPLFDTQIYGGVGSGFSAARWDVAPDGKRFLVNTQVGETGSSPITVVLNWTAGFTNQIRILEINLQS